MSPAAGKEIAVRVLLITEAAENCLHVTLTAVQKEITTDQ